MTRKTAIVLGLGEIGRPIWNLLSSAYGVTEVRGFDPVKEINPPSPGEKFNFMHICFPQTQYFVPAVYEYAQKYLEDDEDKPNYIIIHSTLHPGTMKKLAFVFNIIANNDFPHVFYSPVRGNIRDDMEWGLKTYTKFVAGAYNYSTDTVIHHLKTAGMPAKQVSSPKSLEYSKLFNLAYYGTCIAIFQEIERVVESENLNYEEIKDFIFSTETDSKGKVPRPRYYGGHIGGHCVIPALEKLIAAHDSELFKSVILSNVKRERELTLKE